MNRFRTALTAAAAVLSLSLAACSGGGTDSNPTNPNGDFAGGINVVAAVSPEKVNMFADLAGKFKNSDEYKALEQKLGKPVNIAPVAVSSGEANRLLKGGWPVDQTDKPQPVIWSPASTTWPRTTRERCSSSARSVAAPAGRRCGPPVARGRRAAAVR